MVDEEQAGARQGYAFGVQRHAPASFGLSLSSPGAVGRKPLSLSMRTLPQDALCAAPIRSSSSAYDQAHLLPDPPAAAQPRGLPGLLVQDPCAPVRLGRRDPADAPLRTPAQPDRGGDRR